VVNALKKYAESKGYQIVLFEGYDSGTTDFAPFINKIPPNVDAIMGGGHFADTSTFARQIFEKGLKPKLVALLVAPPEPKFAELGEACVAIIGASQWEPAAKYSPEAAKAANKPWVGPTVSDFVKAYKSKYNEEPSYHSAGGYVSGLLIEQAIRQAGSTATDKVKAALDQMDIDTFYGNIKFDISPGEHGLQVGHDMVYVQWMKEGGKFEKEIVWPPDARTKSVILCYTDKKPSPGK
jgi:ABC-type branched-subunit amino acid transport system substrate-binding protein